MIGRRFCPPPQISFLLYSRLFTETVFKHCNEFVKYSLLVTAVNDYFHFGALFESRCHDLHDIFSLDVLIIGFENDLAV